VLVPLFPRPPAPPPENNLYLHALSRASLQVRDAALARVDLQLIAMIDDARAALARAGRKIQPRVLIDGFSAAGMFANRFAVLHPDRTLAASIGSPGGWPIAPVADDHGRPLPYPLGVADVEVLTGRRLDRDGLRKVRFLFQLGDADTNDSVTDRDGYSSAAEAVVMRLFGKTPVARWPAAQRLYEAAHLRARFVLYPGVGHTLTPEMRADIEALFRATLHELP
jgi:dienelactone hydrolase